MSHHSFSHAHPSDFSKQVDTAEDAPSIKSRLESEERNIKDLQERVTELSKKVLFKIFFFSHCL